jgi:hypothetical protein
MQQESKQNKRSKRGDATRHGGEASVVARACKFLLNPRANAALSVRLVGAAGVAEGRVTTRASPHGEAWRAPVIINRCRSLLAAQFARGSGTAFDRSENGYGAPSKLPPPPGPAARRARGSARGIAADARSSGLRLRSLSPGEGKGRPGVCPNINQLPRSGPMPTPPGPKTHCAATTYLALWIGTGLANPRPSPASP